MDAKLKHLEFIQNVITRMANNSFLIKGWSVTLVAALFAMESKDKNLGFAFMVFIPIASFWILDAYFLSLEKQFRELFKKAVAAPENQVTFDMNPAPYNAEENTWAACLTNTSLAWFHGSLLSLALLMIAILTGFGACKA
ncbi:hypothetical protein [Prosthecobacter vanneervenii]|uniref:Uncharacterized protein n=1 Tax=Prosthecobacter vanneervenii TaxID=48466 RepID=A0A7W7YGG5_9BACT|nr:hypothetical protein [Prosthecobacter vanneervenii]MBB5035756.1 hypothetical protein [Prosthecobacter vanneervenii]